MKNKITNLSTLVLFLLFWGATFSLRGASDEGTTYFPGNLSTAGNYTNAGSVNNAAGVTNWSAVHNKTTHSTLGNSTVGGSLTVTGAVSVQASVSANGVMVTNGISMATRLLAGTGGFFTNKVIVSTNGHFYINGGLTNNFFSHVVGSGEGIIDWFTFTMTNASGTDKPMGWGYVTNNWNFIWSGGTNLPTVMTNMTAWEGTGYKDGSNVVIGLASRKFP